MYALVTQSAAIAMIADQTRKATTEMIGELIEKFIRKP